MKSFLIGIGMKKTVAILTVIALTVGASAGYMSINGDKDVNDNSSNPPADEDSNTPTLEEDNNNPIANDYIQDFIDDINELNAAIQNLPNSAFKYPPEQRKNAFANKLDAVIELVTDGNYIEALDKLEDDIRSKMDGDPGHEDKSSGHGKKPDGHYAGNDWVIDDGAREQLNALIDDIENADYDGDGLSYWDEVKVYGTDPFNPDTDGDGLNDGGEVNVYGTDPLNPDTDGDRLTDGNEVNIYTTDPNDLDTDDDGLNDGDELDYWNSRVDVGWDSDLEANMLTLGDGLINIIDPDSDGDGLLDGVEVSGWNIEIESSPLTIVTVYADPTLGDTDGDGLDDKLEHDGWDLVVLGITIHVKTDPSSIDSDGDGITDYAEKEIYHSSPADTTTYGTHIPDSSRAEVIDDIGTSALDPPCNFVNGVMEYTYMTEFKQKVCIDTGTATYMYVWYLYQPPEMVGKDFTMYTKSVDDSDIVDTDDYFNNIKLVNPDGTEESLFDTTTKYGEFDYTVEDSKEGWHKLSFDYTMDSDDSSIKFKAIEETGEYVPLAWMDDGGSERILEVTATFYTAGHSLYLRGGALGSFYGDDYYSYIDEISVDDQLMYRRAFDRSDHMFPLGYYDEGYHTVHFYWKHLGAPARHWLHICEHGYEWDDAQITYMGNIHTKDYYSWTTGLPKAGETPVMRRDTTFMVIGNDANLETNDATIKIYRDTTEQPWDVSNFVKKEEYLGGDNWKEHWEVTIPSDIAVGEYSLKMFVSGSQIGNTQDFYVIFNPYKLIDSGLTKDEVEAYAYDEDEDGLVGYGEEDYGRDEWGMHYASWSPYGSGFKFNERKYNYGSFNQNKKLFQIAIGVADGKSSDHDVAVDLLWMVSNMIKYDHSNVNQDGGVPGMLTHYQIDQAIAAAGSGGTELGLIDGECLDYANLLAAFYRAIGIPARPAFGADFTTNQFVYHEWTEAYIIDLASGSDHWYCYDGMDDGSEAQGAIHGTRKDIVWGSILCGVVVGDVDCNVDEGYFTTDNTAVTIPNDPECTDIVDVSSYY